MTNHVTCKTCGGAFFWEESHSMLEANGVRVVAGAHWPTVPNSTVIIYRCIDCDTICEPVIRDGLMFTPGGDDGPDTTTSS